DPDAGRNDSSGAKHRRSATGAEAAPGTAAPQYRPNPVRPSSTRQALRHSRHRRWTDPRDYSALGLATRGARLREPAARVDRSPVAEGRRRSRPTGAAVAVARRAPRADRLRELRTAAPAVRARRCARPDGEPRQHPQPAMALGIVQPQRPHLPELAAGDDAGVGQGLRTDPRADALETDGSLAEVLEAGRRRLPG